MSFTNKIANYTNSTSAENVTDALAKGIDYTLSCIKKYNPTMLSQFANAVNNGNTTFSDIFEQFHIFELLSVDRKQSSTSYWARPIDEKMMQKAEDTSSIYYATYHDPVYSINASGTFSLLPVETSTNLATIFFVRHSEGKTVDDSNETLKDNEISFGGNTTASSEHFPNWAKELVVLHAAECVLMERLSDFRAKLPTDLDADTTLFDALPGIDLDISYTFPSTDYQDALDKAQNLIDGTTMGGDTEPESAQYWLADEDEDMVASTLSVASQELQRASSILAEFNAEISAKVADKSQDLQAFQANLQKKISLYDKIIQKLSTDYQWQTTQLQMLAGKKQEFIQHQLQGGVSDTLDEGKARG
tara:strand:- start:2101 stop:3183 length:1083 start_codon:yes stop_codon:yes gene_type:complete